MEFSKKILLKNGKPIVQTVPTPKLKNGMVLVKTAYSFVSSGTELETIKSSNKNLFEKFFSSFQDNFKKIFESLKENGFLSTKYLIEGSIKKYLDLGYSSSGVVVSACKDSGFKPGDLVACAGFGFAGHSEFLLVPKNLVCHVLEKDSLKEASISAIGAIALQSLRRSELKVGETLCVQGLGLIGLLTVQLAKIAGLRVFGVDLNPERLKLAKEFGCDQTLLLNSEDFFSKANFFTGGYGFDSVVVSASSKSDDQILNQAIKVCRKRGKVVLVGDVKIQFDREEFYKKEIDFLISCSYGPGRYESLYEKKGLDYPFDLARWTQNRNLEYISNLICQKKLKVAPLISKDFFIKDANKAYNFLKKGGTGVVFSYLESSCKEPEKNKEESIKPYILNKNEKLNVAVVGAGGFAKTKLLPILKKNKDVELKTVVDLNSSSALNFKEVFGFKDFTTDFLKVSDDPEVDLVIISTPHKNHFVQSFEFLRKGKAVFVEKPMATSFKELEELENFIFNKKNFFYCVDFNRSHSLIIKKLKKVLEKRSLPIFFNYKVNAGFAKKGSWIDDPEQAGRIVGEACHFFELFLSVVNSEVSSISAVPIRSKNFESLKDNFSVLISFSDGSLANLSYISISNNGLNKEELEISWDSKSVFIKDFQRVDCFGLDSKILFDNQTLHQEKGHDEILNKFISAVKKNDFSINNFNKNAVMATKISFYVKELIENGGGTINFDSLEDCFYFQKEEKEKRP